MHGKRKRRRHALLRGDKLYIGMHPEAQGLDWRGLRFQLFGQINKLLHLTAVDGFEQGFAGREMPVQGSDADTGASCHGLKARLRTADAEDRLGSL